MKLNNLVFLNIATTDYDLHTDILRLSIVDIANNVLFDCTFKSTRCVRSRWAGKIESSEIEFSSKVEEILSVLKDKVVIAYNAYFCLGSLERQIMRCYPSKDTYSVFRKIKSVCLMQECAVIFQEPYYHNLNSLSGIYTHVTTRFQRFTRIVHFYKIDSYFKDFLYHDFVCHKSSLEDTFALTHIFSKVLSYNKDDYCENFLKQSLLKELNQHGVI